jgi:DNA-binding IclR family transcriptional regulator
MATKFSADAKPRPQRFSRERAGGMRNFAKSASRALDVLELFAVEQRPLGATEVAQALDLPGSSADQLLKTMTHAAYVSFDATSKRYYPSPRLAPFAGWLLQEYFGDNRLHALIDDLQRRVGGPVVLATRFDTVMQVVDVVGAAIPKGMTIPLTSVPGIAFLSSRSDGDVRSIIKRAVLYGMCSAKAADEVMLQTDLARTRGFACGRSVDLQGWTVALTLPEGPAGVPLVLSLGTRWDIPEGAYTDLFNTMQTSVQGFLH